MHFLYVTDMLPAIEIITSCRTLSGQRTVIEECHVSCGGSTEEEVDSFGPLMIH